MAEKPVQRPTRAVPSAPRLAPRIVLLVALAVAVVAGAVAGYAEWRLRRDGAGPAAAALDAAARSHELADAQRLEAVTLAAARLAGHPDVRTTLAADAPEEPRAEATAPAAAIAVAALEEALDRGRFELAVALPRGEDAEPVRAGGPEEAAAALSASELVERARSEGEAQGAWSLDGRLYLAAAHRVVEDFESLGVVAVAELVGRASALEARAVARAETAYLAAGEGGGPPEVVASTFGGAAADALLPALESAGALEAALREGSRAGPLELRLGGARYRAAVGPLEDVVGRPAGARVTAVEAGTAAALLRTVQAVAAAAGLAGLLLGALGALLVVRGTGRERREVVAAAQAARAGDLAGAARHAVPEPLAAFFADAEEKRALEGVVAAAVREGGAVSRDAPERRRGAVLVVEMPRYARLGADDEPRDVAGRLERDLHRVRRAVGIRGGRVEASLGHRVLAAFEGGGAAARALGAGAEILRLLSEPENAFDEPVPPAVALATGEMVLGGPEGARTVTGLPVQQAESLLREASSGDLILGRQVFRELEPALAEAGVELPSQRGLLTPQPVYVLGVDRARRAAAALETDRGTGAPEASALAPGVLFADRFVLEERLAGGRGAVAFAARDRETEALVALKVLRRDFVQALDALQALDAPIRGLLRVAHPGLARVVDLGTSDGAPYLAGELVDGPSLAAVLERRGALPGAAALRLARGVAGGLGALHAAGFAHGDLRPETVLLEPRGRARIVDVGVGLVLPPPGTDAAVDGALGPPRYLAPERLAGASATPAADVYAAGALLVEAFTGRPLYGPLPPGLTGPEAWDVLRDRIAAGPPEPPDPTELPDGLAPVLERCLARDPAARYADGGELARALEAIRADLVATG